MFVMSSVCVHISFRQLFKTIENTDIFIFHFFF
jgi:hypothetical protein